MTELDYLTLLVHLGVVSVGNADGRTIFKATSTYHRSKYLEKLIQNSLGSLMAMSSADEIYNSGAERINRFLFSISGSGMKWMISWARTCERPKNTLMELQFQEFLLSAIKASTNERWIPMLKVNTRVLFMYSIYAWT
mmetsp:Transcript_4094/g.6848  ORF Transcript_4094/g.6848 Transcript_4094/m.6848 type:complete len:138 (-) Transcript_4094:609-1022(-)